jgi:hypothetical protein
MNTKHLSEGLAIDNENYISFGELDEKCLSEVSVLEKLRPWQRIRRVDARIQLDTRCSICRTFTRDSRWKALDDFERILGLLLKDATQIFNNRPRLKIVLDALCLLSNTTYRNDKKWCNSALTITNNTTTTLI